ncbi:MAG: hypothetical protein RRY40_06350, partial [Oscillospiraceae bacterium]
GVPTFILCMFGVLGALPIITGMDISIIAAMGVGLDALCELIYIIGCYKLPTKFPKEAAAAPFKIKNPKALYVFLTVAAIVMFSATYVDLADLSMLNWICVIAYMVFAVCFTQFRYKHVEERANKDK